MDFEQVELLYLMIPVVVLWFFIRYKKNNIESLFAPEVLEKICLNKHSSTLKMRLRFLLLAVILILLSLSQPILKESEVKVRKYSSNLVIAIDMSKSMLANDVYPNRFELAKHKLLTSLDKINDKRIAILGFTSQSFLVSPLTDDFYSLKFLIKNLLTDGIDATGTNLFNVLHSANNLLDETSNKQILLLTDGSDNNNFDKEIAYANKHNLQIFIFDTASESGGSIQTKNGLLKDNNKNIVYVKENPDIKKLALQTQGKYLKYSLNNNDLLNFINTFKKYDSSKDIKINHKQQLFYYPLLLALILLFLAFFSPPSKLREIVER